MSAARNQLDRCVVLSVPIGAGHHMAARALCEAIVDMAGPRTEYRILNALEYLGPEVGKLAKDMYFGVLDEAPDLWGLVYEQRGLSELFRPAGEVIDDVRAAALIPVIEELDPQVILAMHPIACGLAAGLRRRRVVRCPVVAVVTDFDAHPAWRGRGIDLYITATDEVGAELERGGLASGSVASTGIPLRSAFTEIRSRSGAHEQFGLDESRFTILLMGGGLGLGPIGEVARSLSSVPGPIQLALVAGRNRELEASARSWAEHATAPLHVFGHVDEMWGLIAAADLAIGKPGGLTCAELLAAGVPFIALDPIPGQEKANSRVLVREGAALEAGTATGACGQVLELLESPPRLEAMRTAALRLGRPMAARVAARQVIALVDRWTENPDDVPSSELDPVAEVSHSVAREVDKATKQAASQIDMVGKAVGLDRATESAASELDSFAEAVGLKGKDDDGLEAGLRKLRKRFGLK